MVKTWLLADGRTYKGHSLHADKYKMAKGVVTQRQCGDCKEFKPISEFSIIQRNGKDHFNCYCHSCYKYRCQVANDLRSRRDGVPRRRLTEFSITRKDGLLGLECSICKRWLPLNDFRLKKDGSPKGFKCRRCFWQSHTMHAVIRRIGKVYGEDSPEYALVKGETRYHYVQAVRKVLGMVSDCRVLAPEEQWPVRRILPKLPGGEIPQSAREIVERVYREAISQNRKGRDGNTYVPMLEMQAV